MGIIRVKYVRDDGDDTAYQDYAIPAGEAIGSPDTFLITASHWESGREGHGRDGGTSAATVTSPSVNPGHPLREDRGRRMNGSPWSWLVWVLGVILLVLLIMFILQRV